MPVACAETAEGGITEHNDGEVSWKVTKGVAVTETLVLLCACNVPVDVDISGTVATGADRMGETRVAGRADVNGHGMVSVRGCPKVTGCGWLAEAMSDMSGDEGLEAGHATDVPPVTTACASGAPNTGKGCTVASTSTCRAGAVTATAVQLSMGAAANESGVDHEQTLSSSNGVL